MLRSILGFVLVVLTAAVCTAAATFPERHSTPAQRQSLTVIIYGDFALIRDVRLLNLDRGENRVVFDDVSPQMAPETAYLGDLSTGAPIWVHEQNFETAVLSPDALLARSVGHTVTVIRDEPPGREVRESAVVLSVNGPILKFKDRIETSLPPNSRIVYTSLPVMRLTPDFMVDFDSPAAAPHPVALGYLTGGLSWAADYVARLNGSADRLNIDAFITLHNDSGMTFDDAAVRVVAGSVQRADQNQVRTIGRVTVMGAASNVYAENSSRPLRQSVSEFYEYSLPERRTLRTGETKQTLLLYARDVPVHQLHEATSTANDFQTQGNGEQRLPVGATLEFDNDGHGLGVPLPAGVFHLYKNDQSGEPVFIGEAAITDTPRNQLVQLDLGQSFDVTVRRVQTDYKEIPEQLPYRRTEYITDYRVTIANAKTKAIVLDYAEQLGGIWQITQESLPHQKTSSSTVLWKVPVPAGGQTVLTFQVDSR